MRYHAFISYSHAADGKLAPSLQSGLQRLAKPLFRLPVIKIFRDQTSLSANPGLWSEIENNLAQSEYFILMASELAARSVWVGKEVEWWQKNRPMDKLLMVVTDGAISWDTAATDFDWTQTTCLPGNLKAAFKEEPLYVDMRWAKGENDLSLRHSQFRANVMDLAAPLHGRPKDELDSEDIRQYRRTRTLRWSAISIIMLLAIGASIAAVLAIKNATTALSRQYAAEAQLRIGEGRLGDAVISSLKAYRTLDTMEARAALFKTFQASWDFHAVLQGHQAAVKALVFRKEGKELLTWSKDNTLISWDVTQRRPNGKPLHGEPFDARTAVFSPDGSFLATGTANGKVQIFDSNNLHRLRELTNGNTEEILSLKFNDDGSLLAAGHIGGTVTIWDMNRFSLIKSKLGRWNAEDEGLPADLAFRQDGRYLATADETPGSWVVVMDFPNGKTIAKLSMSSSFGVNTRVGYLAMDGIGNEKTKYSLVVGTSEGVVQIYEQSGNDLAGFRFSHGGIHHSGRVTAIASAPNLLATGGKDGSVNTWNDVQSWNPVTPASWANSPIEGLAFSPNSNYLAAGLENGTVIVYLEPLERPRHLASVFSQQGEPPKHDSEETNKELKNWLNKIALGKESPLQNITPIALSPDGKWLLGQDEKLGASLWDTKSFKRIAPPNPWLDLTQQAFSPDNHMLAVVTKDNLLVWNISEGRVVGDLRGHSERVVDLAFSNDGKLLAYIDKDGSVILWDPINARRLSDPLLGQGEDEDIRSWLRFEPSGKMLWADGLSIPAYPDSWIEDICGRFDPVLSKTEWSEMFGNQTYPATCYSVKGDNPIKAN